MEYPIGVIREFKTEQFTVIVDALPEDDLDLSWDETGEVAHDLDRGKFIAFVARARVFLNVPGESSVELASDYLGGCIYESLEAFMDHRECGRANRENQAKGEAGRCGSYFSDMVSQVCREARKALAKLQTVKVRGAA